MQKYLLILSIIFLSCIIIGHWNRNESVANSSDLNDLQEICQLTLDLDWLQKFYHSDFPERKPLIILKNRFFNEPLMLTKFNEPVLFFSEEEIRKQKIEAYFEFTDIKIDKDKATVKFEYPIEGVFGEVVLQNSKEKWKIITQRGGER